jgi:hypothetical protein
MAMREFRFYAPVLVAALLTGSPVLAASPDHLMMMFNAPAGAKADYDRWYDRVHAPMIVGIKGFVDARRADADDAGRVLSFAPPRPFMIRYTLRTRDLRASFAAVPGPDPAHPAPVAAGGFALVFDAVGGAMRGAGPAVFAPGAATQTYELYVLENAKAGQDKALTRWYRRHHLPEILGLPGFIGARRFIRSPVQRDRSGPSPHYLTVYRIETDRIDRLLASLEQQHGRFTPTDSVDDDGKQRFLYRLSGPLIKRRGFCQNSKLGVCDGG